MNAKLTKFQKNLLWNYYHAQYNDIFEAYGCPTIQKQRAFDWIKYEDMRKFENAHGLSIPTRNTFNFTCAFVYDNLTTGKLHLRYYTSTNVYDFPVCDISDELSFMMEQIGIKTF